MREVTVTSRRATLCGSDQCPVRAVTVAATVLPYRYRASVYTPIAPRLLIAHTSGLDHHTLTHTRHRAAEIGLVGKRVPARPLAAEGRLTLNT